MIGVQTLVQSMSYYSFVRLRQLILTETAKAYY